MTIGVFGGSFNPVHAGHIALARSVVAQGKADRVMMVLSPLNPLKSRPEELIEDSLRLEMLRIACEPWPELEASDIELTMPRPSYSIATLRRLSELFPDDRFRLIIGADNWALMPQWREHQAIIRDYSPIVYPRKGFPLPGPGDGAEAIDAQLWPMSSTEIRSLLKAGHAADKLLPQGVGDFIRRHDLYTM